MSGCGCAFYPPPTGLRVATPTPRNPRSDGLCGLCGLCGPGVALTPGKPGSKSHHLRPVRRPLPMVHLERLRPTLTDERRRGTGVNASVKFPDPALEGVRRP